MDFTLVLTAINSVALVVVIALLATRKASPAGGDQADVLKAIESVRGELGRNIANTQNQTDAKFETFRQSLELSARTQRDEAAVSRQELQNQLAVSLTRVSEQVENLSRANGDRLAQMQNAMRESVERMQKGNEEKLEKMRETVDEKLQSTLVQRLDSSFSQVSERLKEVQQGLGAMQSLANGVGNLQKVLTNVKNRGGWGETQLARQLEDMLSPEQYEANVKTKPNSREVVEFAVKLPGRQDGETVYLPIDSKFPQEDYERLLAAQDSADKAAVDAATKEVEKAIKLQAKDISEKYIYVPNTVDFAIMYLPTEGLFAEVLRIPGLVNELQNTHRVVVTGPTTLMSLLNSIQLGFKTLAIEKSTSDVWKILGAAKTEFEKYARVWEKLSDQLTTAQNTVTSAGVRTRAVAKTLRTIEVSASMESSPEFKAIENLVASGDVADEESEE